MFLPSATNIAGKDPVPGLERMVYMKIFKFVLGLTVSASLFFSALLLSGCGSFWKGAGVGAVGAGAAYEVNSKRQLDQLEKDYKDGKMSKEEYESRKDQIQKGSLIY